MYDELACLSLVHNIGYHLGMFAILGAVLWVILDRLDSDGHLPWSDAGESSAEDR